MSAAVPARFTFDLDLGHDPLRARSDPRRGEELSRACAEARAEGMVEGERNATAMAGQRLAAAAELLGERATSLLQAADEARLEVTEQGTALAATIARKLAGHLLAREPTAEIEALIAECLASIDSAPHLVVRCHPDLAEAIRAGAEARIDRSGFAGRLVVLGDPEIGLTDGRIEWADGGLVRDMAAISAGIDARIAAFLAARAGGAAQMRDDHDEQ